MFNMGWPIGSLPVYALHSMHGVRVLNKSASRVERKVWLRLHQIRAGHVGPAEGAQPHLREVREKFVDRGALARPGGDGVFVENENAAAGNARPDRRERGLGRPVEVAVEMHQRKAHALIFVEEPRHGFFDLAAHELDARLERNEAVGILRSAEYCLIVVSTLGSFGFASVHDRTTLEPI
jgi:hypothetical protein